jgi:hypothetical protein
MCHMQGRKAFWPTACLETSRIAWYEVLQWTKSLGSCICGEGEDRMADALILALNVM